MARTSGVNMNLCNNVEIMIRCASVSSVNLIWNEALEFATYFKFKKNFVIPHDKEIGIYYIISGKVVLSYFSLDGVERTALIYESGSIFNEARAFTEYNPSGQFKCVTDVELYFFPRNVLLNLDFISKFPHLIQNLLISMSGKILLHYLFLSEMGTGSCLSKLCRLIYSLAIKNNRQKIFHPQMTQTDIAALLGLHRTTLARTIRKLKELGIIEKFSHNEIIIANYDLLQQYASY